MPPKRRRNASFNKADQGVTTPHYYDRAHANVSPVANARKTGRSIYSATPNPDQTRAQSKEVSAEAKRSAQTRKDQYPVVPSELNPTDAALSAAQKKSDGWNEKSGFKLEDYTNGPEYRGEGLAPTTRTVGRRVIRK